MAHDFGVGIDVGLSLHRNYDEAEMNTQIFAQISADLARVAAMRASSALHSTIQTNFDDSVVRVREIYVLAWIGSRYTGLPHRHVAIDVDFVPSLSDLTCIDVGDGAFTTTKSCATELDDNLSYTPRLLAPFHTVTHPTQLLFSVENTGYLAIPLRSMENISSSRDLPTGYFASAPDFTLSDAPSTTPIELNDDIFESSSSTSKSGAQDDTSSRSPRARSRPKPPIGKPNCTQILHATRRKINSWPYGIRHDPNSY